MCLVWLVPSLYEVLFVTRTHTSEATTCTSSLDSLGTVGAVILGCDRRMPDLCRHHHWSHCFHTLQQHLLFPIFIFIDYMLRSISLPIIFHNTKSCQYIQNSPKVLNSATVGQAESGRTGAQLARFRSKVDATALKQSETPIHLRSWL